MLTALAVGMALAAPLAAEDEDAVAATDPWAEDVFPTDAVEVGAQRKGTFGDGQEEAELYTALGADLRNGTIRMLDAETVEFTIGLWDLPPTGGVPEAIRYTWDFSVDGEVAQLDGKWSNYTRGTCDPTSGQCNPPGRMPRDPGLQPFLFRANMTSSCLGASVPPTEVPVVGEVGLECAGLNFNAYEELDVLQGAFAPDGESSTITVTVPVGTIDLIDGVEFGPCSEIRPVAGLFGGTIESMPSAFISSTAFPSDTVNPHPARLGGGVFQAPPPDGFADCAEYLATL